MSEQQEFEGRDVTRQELAEMSGPVVVEFGASWCGICRGFAPDMKRLLADHPDVLHLKVEDGRGKPLGRFFRVKLWPTFVLMRDGEVVRQLVRPGADEMRTALDELAGHAASNPSS